MLFFFGSVFLRPIFSECIPGDGVVVGWLKLPLIFIGAWMTMAGECHNKNQSQFSDDESTC